MKQPFPTPCPLWAEKLAATHPDDLSAFERLALNTHMASCAACASIQAEYEAMGKQISQLPAVEPRPGIPARLLDLWPAQGASLASAPSMPTFRARRMRRGRVLVQTLVAVLVVGVLIGSFLVLFTFRPPGPAGSILDSSGGWKLTTSPSPGSTQNVLNSVAAVSDNDVWAVGYFSNSTTTVTKTSTSTSYDYGMQSTLVEHWNGGRWSVVSSPNTTLAQNVLNAVAVVSASDIWTVGYSSDNKLNVLQTLIEHWDGTRWSIVSSPNPGSTQYNLSGVAVVSVNDIWAVGDFSTRDNRSQTLIERWDGSRWNIVSSQNLGSNDNPSLSAVAVVSANDIWAVGASSNSHNFAVQPLIEHWNGTRWSIVKSQNVGYWLSGVAVVSANDIWAVGSSSNTHNNQSQPFIEHWNGMQWSVVPSTGNPIGYSNYLSGVAAVSANDVWAVGASPRQYPLLGPALIEHWDGTHWSIVSGPNLGKMYNNYLLGVVRVPRSNQVWAVGNDGSDNDAIQTIAEMYS